MQDGDLATWVVPRIYVVLEDTLAHVTGRMERRGIRKTWVPNDPELWQWAITTIKTILRYVHNNVAIVVITFLSPEVAEAAAEWLAKYDIDVAEVEYYDLEAFQHSLIWRRNNIQRVVDTDPARLQHYGQLGYQTVFDGAF